MSIRTTVTLDDDVLERVKQESKVRGLSFRETLNELLRQSFLLKSARPKAKPFKVQPRHMGLRRGLPYDSTSALLEYAEGERHR
jgi:hypothetical protein